MDRLVLVSPVGVPNNPYETSKDAPMDSSIADPPDSTVQSEFSQLKSNSKSAIQQPRPIPRWATLLWEANFSPFMFVRLPIVGPKFASGWTSWRFGELPTPEEQQALSQYAYQIFRLPGSGEYALTYLLAPGAYARRPLIERVKGLQNDIVLKKVAWIYGSYDWMDVDAGKEASELLEEDLELVSQVHVVERAGHNVHLDNPEGFNRIIRRELNVKV